MDTNALKKFAQSARNLLIDQVTAKLALVLDPASPARREHPEATKKLDAAITAKGKQQVIEQVAYTWFNRFTALRFMDVNGYTNPRVVSPADGQTRPEILAEAMAHNLPDGAPATIAALLDGRTPSNDPQAEAYRLLLVHACNQWHGPMPFLFEEIDDFTELLMPEDLLSPTSILAELRKAMTADACQDVEVIGWLYQFYISEKKDQVFAGLKKNIKITAENIPAATQLFTPHWIVRYLVENSLGRLWLLNRPQSKLAAQMDYYIAPEEPETDFLRITKPEDIRICDPAAGSGHMLTYAFDLLHAIYEEEGYEPTEIPALILTHNLHGVEIDDRAGALAAFALVMKAAAKLGRRRFLRLGVQPKICVMQDVRFTPAEMQDVAAVVGRDLFTADLRETLGQFEQAKNFGSLIVPKLRDPAEVARVVRLKDFGGDLLLRDVQDRVLKVLEMAEALSRKYYVVVANPPYMGTKGMNEAMSGYLSAFFPEGKSDLFAAFMLRTQSLSRSAGYSATVTMQSWMFLSSLEALRRKLISKTKMLSLCHMDNMVMGIAFGTSSVVFQNSTPSTERCSFVFVCQDDLNPETNSPYHWPPSNYRNSLSKPEKLYFSKHPESFLSVPGSPVCYWASDVLTRAFQHGSIADITISDGQNKTGDNGRFLRRAWEISRKSLGKDRRWIPYAKGGDFRRWEGNLSDVVDWSEEARHHYRRDHICRIIPEYLWWRPGITWGFITSGMPSFRYLPEIATFDVGGSSIFFYDEQKINECLGLLNSKVAKAIFEFSNPTVNFQVKNIREIPYANNWDSEKTEAIVSKIREISSSDWEGQEPASGFSTLSLLAPEHRDHTLAGSYARLRAHWQGMTDEMQRLEEENNRIFVDAYGLQDELTPEVPLDEITLTCNPAYRYGDKASTAELETRLRSDTMAEFLHYAVGCMFGRYSLDAPGLILANQGEGLADYLARIPEPSFDVDADNVIPVLDGDWFADDVTERFRKFLRVTFGDAKFQKNLSFIEAALGKDIRKWFTKDFFDYHVRRYKKRPIYWMFSSPKGTFNALIYMHRYRPDTVSVVLNDYLREFISKLQAERGRLEKLVDDPNATQSQRVKAQKDVAVVIKQIAELEEWEREVVFPLAQAKIEIDLDDGVKRNYPKFGAALKPIKGLEAADD